MLQSLFCFFGGFAVLRFFAHHLKREHIEDVCLLYRMNFVVCHAASHTVNKRVDGVLEVARLNQDERGAFLLCLAFLIVGDEHRLHLIPFVSTVRVVCEHL